MQKFFYENGSLINFHRTKCLDHSEDLWTFRDCNGGPGQQVYINPLDVMDTYPYYAIHNGKGECFVIKTAVHHASCSCFTNTINSYCQSDHRLNQAFKVVLNGKLTF